MQSKEKIHYETNAEEITTTGWACKTCQKFYGDYKAGAQYCCATVKRCECGREICSKYHTYCTVCVEQKKALRWEGKYQKAITWDGETPLYSERHDKYLFGADHLLDYLADLQAELEFESDELTEPTPTQIQDDLFGLRLIVCKPNNGRHFCMEEFLCDDLPEDGGIDSKEIDKLVNDWIAANAPFSWEPSGPAVSVTSVMKHAGYETPWQK